jgi:hypothetical protein
MSKDQVKKGMKVTIWNEPGSGSFETGNVEVMLKNSGSCIS